MANNSVGIVHIADVHLDSPFTVGQPEQAARRRTELRAAFDSAVFCARVSGAKIFLIAGDLFDTKYATRDTIEQLNKEFSQLPNCYFFITPGNHDPYNDSSPYKNVQFPPNVHIFKGPKEFVELTELGVRVYGMGFNSKEYLSSPVIGYGQLDSNMINILVCHGDMSNPFSSCAPVTVADIGASGFDYIALGHIHKRTPILCENGVYYSYSGCVEGRGFDETGYKGGYVGTVSKGKAELRFERFSKKRFEIKTVSLDGVKTKQEALDRIRAEIREYTEDTALRLILEGEPSAAFTVTQHDIGEGYAYPYYIDIRDNTALPQSFFANDNTLKGMFCTVAAERAAGKTLTDDERDVLRDALKYGLAALDGRDV